MGSRRSLRRGPTESQDLQQEKLEEWRLVCVGMLKLRLIGRLVSGSTRLTVQEDAKSREETRDAKLCFSSCLVQSQSAWRKRERESLRGAQPIVNDPIGRLYEKLVIRLRRESRVCFDPTTLQHSCSVSFISFSLFFATLQPDPPLWCHCRCSLTKKRFMVKLGPMGKTSVF
jgi:hypothetical protein